MTPAEMAKAAKRAQLQAAAPLLRQVFANKQEMQLKQALAKLAKGELTPEQALTTLSVVQAIRLIEQEFATSVEMED